MNRVLHFLFVAAALAASAALVMAGPAEARAQAGCDETALAQAKGEFQRLKDSRRRGNKANDEEFRAASEQLIFLSEDCYAAKYGSLGGGQQIDDGGLWVQGESIQSRHNLHGTKWGAGTSFASPGNNFDATGPRLAGGEISYSFMADGVSIGNDGDSGASCAPACSNTSLLSFAVTDSGGDTIFAQCLLNEIEAAFAAWSAVADITFVNVTDNSAAFDAAGASGDIRIGFHSFDGASNVLAHAFFPPPNGTSAAGDLHFDLDESWGCSPTVGMIDIGIVALHEIGHSIGLRHEPSDLAVMNASYNPALIFGPLADDIIGAGEIYGEAGAATTAFFGDVGIGTDSPSASLEVRRDDGSAKILVEDASAAAAIRQVFEMRNTGGVGFQMTDTRTDAEAWQFQTNLSGNFSINNVGDASGGTEVIIVKNSGNVLIEGEVTAQAFNPVSDRNLKEGFVPVDRDEILDKLARLPISQWSYKADQRDLRHIGPMAQDFFAVFSLGGSDRTINLLDASGVALAAIQGLQGKLDSENARLRKRLNEQQEEIDSLKQELDELRALLESAAQR